MLGNPTFRTEKPDGSAGTSRRHLFARLYNALIGSFGLLVGRRAQATGYYNLINFAGAGPKFNGSLWAWGNNAYGQLGIGTTVNHSVPVQVGTLTTWTQISAGYACGAVRADGTLWTWGSNTYGELGTNNVTKYSSPVQVGSLSNWAYISIDQYKTATSAIGVRTDGTMWGWGQNTTGQMGTGNTVSHSSPVQVGTASTWVQAYMSAKTGFAIRTDGTMWSWGNGGYGAPGHNAVQALSNPVQIGTLSTWVKMATGGQSTFAMKTDGTVWAWGYNAHGDLGVGNYLPSYSSPIQVLGATPWYVVGFGRSIANNGTLWAWGYNGGGRVGDSTNLWRSSPVQIGSLSTWAKTSTFIGTLAIQTKGSLWAWGLNGSGVLGTNNTTNYSSPVQVGSATNWIMVSTGYYTSLGLQGP